ncbi:MAG: sigma-70 family RNA polymerase sigma factor [Kofleriaceae bacterium]|nr:sigma-70 family RNA polymerase sigma factor [Kofleriaceae bacterium]
MSSSDLAAEAFEADLALARAVGSGDQAALAIFERDIMPVIAPAIAHLDGGTALVADVTAAVRARVLGDGGDGKIHDYRGRGDLRGWLRVVAVREALQIIRARRREEPIAQDLGDRLFDETEALSADEKRVYSAAFAAALATLTPRERNLLRQQFIYGATVDELGALYGVHRATAARWTAQIRETLLRRTRREIADALRLTGDDLESAMGKIAGHVDYSLRHTLSIER